jgi:hypothetical protein
MVLNADQTAQADKIWKKVENLRVARRKAFEDNKIRLKEHPPKWDCDRGSAAAAEIAGQIQQLIETGQMLGLIDEKVNYMDYWG